ncbi:hypothetical protein [Methylobacterium sp. PvR107]|uniref:hypothetical protein n=1 Tax=Methylobacterium sp. PvR107 TaxID=2806597 RepID=UPI001B3DD932|nr:hypothetical protein [Methylobacterium sp. PvR107]MBP1179977.1 hypothetical protein [Methylobacterium sp. PvR107]
MQDSPATADPLAMWAQQALQAQTVALDLSVRLGLLAATASMVWLDLLVPPARAETPAQRARREAPARTARLVRRGIPETVARQGLRVL